uniref:hypothetical protein n=1 Tax=Salmonella enterica TaxID=28901 RepID=UPI000AF993D4|nr:hypothetical protein [Salmonella enterica]
MVFKSPICAWLRHYHANSQLKNHSLSQRYVSLGEIMKNKINTFFIVAFVLTLSACAAKQTIPGAERVELVNDLPD